MVFFYLFLKNESIKIDTNTYDLPENGSKKLAETHKKIKSDIKYLDANHGTFILKSLIFDLNNFTNLNGKCWRFSEFRDGEAHLEKVLDPNNRYSNYIKLKIKYSGLADCGFNITSLEAFLQDDNRTSDKKIKLPIREFKDVILQYFISREILESKRSLKNSKSSFDLLLKIVGKDIHRDTKIEEILK